MIPIEHKDASGLSIFAKLSQNSGSEQTGLMASSEEGQTPASFLEEMAKSDLSVAAIPEDNAQSISAARLPAGNDWPQWRRMPDDLKGLVQSEQAHPAEVSMPLEVSPADVPLDVRNDAYSEVRPVTNETPLPEDLDASIASGQIPTAERRAEPAEFDLEDAPDHSQTEPKSELRQPEEAEVLSLPDDGIAAALSASDVSKASVNMVQPSVVTARAIELSGVEAQTKDVLEEVVPLTTRSESVEKSAKVEHILSGLTSEIRRQVQTPPVENSDKVLKSDALFDPQPQGDARDQNPPAIKAPNNQIQVPVAANVAPIEVMQNASSEVGLDETDVTRGFDLTAPRDRSPFQVLSYQSASPMNATVARQVFGQLSAGLSQLHDGGIEIRLNPVELGRITIQLIEGSAGQSANVLVEKPEVLDLLRRNESLLHNEFEDAGFASMSFSFDQQQNPEHEQDAEFSGGSHEFVGGPQTKTSAPSGMSISTDLDIRL